MSNETIKKLEETAENLTNCKDSELKKSIEIKLKVLKENKTIKK